MLLAQTWPITGQTIDKALETDPLTLALLVIVIVAIVSLINSWLQGRKQSADDNRQDIFFKAFTDEKSPMVVSNNRVATAVEQSNKRSEEQTAALLALGGKTDLQTTELSKQTTAITTLSADFRGYQSTASDAMQEHTKSIDTLIATVAELKVSIEKLIERHEDCQPLKDKLTEVLNALDNLQKQDKRTSQTVAILLTDTPPTGDPKTEAA